jgi:hypothetical protein
MTTGPPLKKEPFIRRFVLVLVILLTGLLACASPTTAQTASPATGAAPEPSECTAPPPSIDELTTIFPSIVRAREAGLGH